MRPASGTPRTAFTPPSSTKPLEPGRFACSGCGRKRCSGWLRDGDIFFLYLIWYGARPLLGRDVPSRRLAPGHAGDCAVVCRGWYGHWRVRAGPEPLERQGADEGRGGRLAQLSAEQKMIPAPHSTPARRASRSRSTRRLRRRLGPRTSPAPPRRESPCLRGSPRSVVRRPAR